MKKLWIGAALGLACWLGAAQAQGGAPAPPLVLVVGGPPGNPGDLLLRTLSGPLGEELGQAVVVENRPGAAGTVGLAAVARARPDGNVLGLLALQTAAAPAMVRTLPYDTLRDFVPVRQLSWVSNVLVAAQDSPFQTLGDVVAAGRAGSLTFASGGSGTPAHLAAELFALEARMQIRHVPFTGAMGGVNALAGGHVQLMFAAAPAVAGLVQAGKLRALAVAAPQRLALVPSVPTLAESGFAGASMRDWHGLVAPAGTPPRRIERLASALGKVLAAQAVQQKLRAAGLEPVTDSTPDTFRLFVASEAGRWSAVVRGAGITLE
jgi:tripartite-type tricarboxylate transporter receptor subunit TctC